MQPELTSCAVGPRRRARRAARQHARLPGAARRSASSSDAWRAVQQRCEQSAMICERTQARVRERAALAHAASPRGRRVFLGALDQLTTSRRARPSALVTVGVVRDLARRLVLGAGGESRERREMLRALAGELTCVSAAKLTRRAAQRGRMAAGALQSAFVGFCAFTRDRTGPLRTGSHGRCKRCGNDCILCW